MYFPLSVHPRLLGDVGRPMTPLQEIQMDQFHQTEYFSGERIGWTIVVAIFLLIIWRSVHWRPPPSGGTPS